MSPATRTRRPHRKSRNGCTECKHRHIRCDELRPSCANCEAAERICSFLTTQTGKQKQKHSHQSRPNHQQQQYVSSAISPELELSNHGNANIVADVGEIDAEPSPQVFHLQNNPSDLSQTSEQLTHDSSTSLTGLDANIHQIPSPALPLQLSNVQTPPADCFPGLPVDTDAASKAIFTPQHMILIHHADTVPNFTGPNRNVIDIAMRHTVDAPYLLDEILALTAFHLASMYPGSAVLLRHLSTELQNRALNSFTKLSKIVPNDDKATTVPRFLFSGILGRHVLADTLTYCSSDFHFFIDRFVECLNLNRGVKTVVPPAWDDLHHSEVLPFVRVLEEAQKKIVSPGIECDPLSRIMDDSDLNEASVQVCCQAIKALQWSFDLCRGLREEEYPQAASALLVRIGAGFGDVLRKHRPEALLVLAYYGVLLHRCRTFKAFGDAGAPMIHAVAGQLGSYWQEALAWPLQELEKGHTS